MAKELLEKPIIGGSENEWGVILNDNIDKENRMNTEVYQKISEVQKDIQDIGDILVFAENTDIDNMF